MQMKTYTAKTFNLSDLNGISNQTLEMHFKLYEGYVTNTNLLTERISEILSDGQVDKEEMPAYSELTRRLGFEYNGMVLHEYYFGNMKPGAATTPAGKLKQAMEQSFGSYENWLADFKAVGTSPGVGWAITFQDPRTGWLSNHWVTLHNDGNIAGYTPIIVMDAWEHAFVPDYKPFERAKYVDAYFQNIDFEAAESRLKK